MARPTSRWAMAKRVTESIISITSAPWSRKASAIVVAVSAALMRTSAGWSEVATTTTERARPSSPRSRSMNSLTSRPRSPTRQMTLTSAFVERAIMPSSDDLPTPEPAKMPRRWPRPQGTSVSSARTPSETCSVMRVRCMGSGGEASIARRSRASSEAPSTGRPSASTTRPSSSTPTGTETGRPVAVTRWPGASPARSPSGISRVRPARKPTTSAGTGSRERPASTRTTSPTSASSPLASTMRPIRSLTRPRWPCRSLRATRSPWAASRASTSATAELIVEHLARALQLGLDGRVDLAVARAQHGAAAGDAAVGLRLEAAAELLGQRPERDAHGGGGVGVHEDEDALAIHQAAQRALDVVEDQVGVGGEGGAGDLLGDAQGERDGAALDAVGELSAVGGQRGHGGAQRLLVGGDLRGALGEAGGVALGDALGVGGLERAVDLVGGRDADRRAELRARGRRLELVEGVGVGRHQHGRAIRRRPLRRGPG